MIIVRMRMTIMMACLRRSRSYTVQLLNHSSSFPRLLLLTSVPLLRVYSTLLQLNPPAPAPAPYKVMDRVGGAAFTGSVSLIYRYRVFYYCSSITVVVYASSFFHDA